MGNRNARSSRGNVRSNNGVDATHARPIHFEDEDGESLEEEVGELYEPVFERREGGNDVSREEDRVRVRRYCGSTGQEFVNVKRNNKAGREGNGD